MINLAKKSSVIRNNLYLFKFVWEACPGRVILCLSVGLLHHFYMFLTQIIFVQYLFNLIQKQRPFREVVTVILAMGAFGVFFKIVRDWYSTYYGERTNHVIYARIHSKMFEKASQMDLGCYEDPEFYNLYIKAITQSNDKIMTVLFTTAEVVYCIFSAILTISVMFVLDPTVIIFSLIPLLITYTLGSKFNNIKYKFDMDNVPFNRKKDYVRRTVYLSDYAKEYRLYDMFSVMAKEFADGVSGIKANAEKYGTKMAVLSFINSFLKKVLIPLASMVYIAFRMIVSKTLMIGDFVGLVNAVNRLTWMVFNISSSSAQYQECYLYAENLRAFLTYEPKVGANEAGIKAENGENRLEIRNASFKYAGQEKPVLKNININIKAGEKIALVGYNGAGKTTLIKLLMRLYDVSDGEVLLNGTDIRNYSLKSYRDLFAAVFQDYKVFSVSVAENVLMKEPENEEDRKTVEKALELAGFSDKLKELKYGIDTTLTREFEEEGVSLSGGENQKIAIARIFTKESSIVILDEPSSALDPISEYKMYEAMLKAAGDKTVIFISHRLSSAVMADRIYLMKDGEIAEQGSHAELMSIGGRYADMFRKQSESYAENIA